MTDAVEGTFVVKQVKWKTTINKQSRKPVVYPAGKWRWEAETREGESDTQNNKEETSCVPCR